MPYLSALEVCSRRGAIQIHVYFTLTYLYTLTPVLRGQVSSRISSQHSSSKEVSTIETDFLRMSCRRHPSVHLRMDDYTSQTWTTEKLTQNTSFKFHKWRRCSREAENIYISLWHVHSARCVPNFIRIGGVYRRYDTNISAYFFWYTVYTVCRIKPGFQHHAT